METREETAPYAIGKGLRMLVLVDFGSTDATPHIPVGGIYCGLRYVGLASSTVLCFAHDEGKQRGWGRRNTERLLMRVRQIAAEYSNQVDTPNPIMHLYPMEDASYLPKHRERLHNERRPRP